MTSAAREKFMMMGVMCVVTRCVGIVRCAGDGAPRWEQAVKGLVGGRRRGGFTLLEMVFAITIGSMVMVGAGSLLVAIQRNERAISRRAEDAAALARIRQVMQRSFSTVLMAPTPSGRASTTAVATAVTEGAQTAAGAGGTGSQAANDRTRSNKILEEARSTTPPRILLSPAISGTGGQNRAGATSFVSTAVMSPSVTLQLPGGMPQRLELVLIDPPVPTQQRDVFEVAKAVRKVAEQRLSRAELAKQKQQEGAVAQAVAVDETEQTEEEDPEGMNDVRAVRGAFELRPQPLARGQQRDESEPQVWEMWWVPERAKRTVQEMRELSKAARVVEEAAVGDPFRIAGNIKTARWRMFHDALKKDEFSAVFRQDVPAYVEMDIEMLSGATAQWLFEVGLQTGPEVQAPKTTEARGAGATPLDASGAPASGATGSTARPAGGAAPGAPGQTVPATPMQPAKPRGRGRESK